MSEQAPASKIEREGDERLATRKVETGNLLNPDLALALSTGPQLKPVSIAAFRLYLVLLVAFMGSLSFGFDTNG
jgi:hypothetical protein